MWLSTDDDLQWNVLLLQTTEQHSLVVLYINVSRLRVATHTHTVLCCYVSCYCSFTLYFQWNVSFFSSFVFPNSYFWLLLDMWNRHIVKKELFPYKSFFTAKQALGGGSKSSKRHVYNFRVMCQEIVWLFVTGYNLFQFGSFVRV